jgi:hypothetical protein
MKKIIKLLDLIGSSEGEDKIILTRAEGFAGTYLDIGCSSPIKDSNTFRLYLAGWKGICIDIRKIRRFQWIRRRDRFYQRTITDISQYKDFDLLDIDIDGIDLEVIKTMTHRPRWIIAETILPSQRAIVDYLSAEYNIIGQTTRNHIFELKTQEKP